nr:unnamed protein product [Callosobruchus analis]
MSENRLNGLANLNIHRWIQVDTNEVLALLKEKGPRRLDFVLHPEPAACDHRRRRHPALDFSVDRVDDAWTVLVLQMTGRYYWETRSLWDCASHVSGTMQV